MCQRGEFDWGDFFLKNLQTPTGKTREERNHPCLGCNYADRCGGTSGCPKVPLPSVSPPRPS